MRSLLNKDVLCVKVPMLLMLVALLLSIYQLEVAKESLRTKDYPLRTPVEIQKKINQLLSDNDKIVVDGKFGKKTMTAWNKALCEQFYKESINLSKRRK